MCLQSCHSLSWHSDTTFETNSLYCVILTFSVKKKFNLWHENVLIYSGVINEDCSGETDIADWVIESVFVLVSTVSLMSQRNVFLNNKESFFLMFRSFQKVRYRAGCLLHFFSN